MSTNMAEHHVPVLVRRTAKEIAEAWWHDNRTDTFRRTWPSVKVYKRECWPFFVPQAKSALVDLMTHPNTTDHVRGEIYDALVAANGAAYGADVVTQHLPPAGVIWN